MTAPGSLPPQNKQPQRRPIPWYFLFWLLAPLLLWWALREVEFAALWRTLRGLTAGQLLVLAGLNTAIILLISLRWWLLVRAQGDRLPFLPVAGYRLIAFGISYFTPGPQFGGEPAQVIFLHKRHQVATPHALASVSLDKILELLANFLFLLLGLGAALQAGMFSAVRPGQALLLLSVPLVLLVIYTVTVWRGLTPLAALLAPAARRFPRLANFHSGVTSAEMQIARFCQNQPLTMVQASLVSLLTWVVMTVEYGYALHALGIPLNTLEAVAALTATRLAFLFPLPGGLGVLEASQILALQSLGYPAAAGLSASLLIRGRDIALGLAGLAVSSWMARRSHREKGGEDLSAYLSIKGDTPYE